MAWYPKAVRKVLPRNAEQPKITPRSVVLHTAVSNGTSLFSFFNGRSAGVESHFYVREDGTVEQYIDTDVRADAQLDGNPYAVSIETWDGAGRVWDGRVTADIPAWNAKQLGALAELLAWICTTHRIPFQKCTAYDGYGIGWHAQFTGPRPSWNQTHACPGARRIGQVPALIAAAKAAATSPEEQDMALTDSDLDKVRAIVRDEVRYLVKPGPAAQRIAGDYTDELIANGTTVAAYAVGADARTRALVKAVQSLSVGLGPGVELAVRSALADGLVDVDVTVHDKTDPPPSA